MAILNHAKNAQQMLMNNAYEELLKFLNSNEGQKTFPLSWKHMLMYFDERHDELKKSEEKIKEYQKFFNTLSNFLPRGSSTNRPLI